MYESSLTLRIKKESISSVQSKIKVPLSILQTKIESLSSLYHYTTSQSSLELSKLEDLYTGLLYKRKEEEKEEGNVIDVVKSENNSLSDPSVHRTRHAATREGKRSK